MASNGYPAILHSRVRLTMVFPLSTNPYCWFPWGFTKERPEVDRAGSPHDEQSGANRVRAKSAWLRIVKIVNLGKISKITGRFEKGIAKLG